MTMKAYSLLEVKQVEEEQRMIRGIATSPTMDRVGDVVVAEGAIFRGPISLHLYHKHDLPVGNVTFGKAGRAGIPFTAILPDVKEAGTVRERVNEAWHSIKYKLLGAVSIGFKPLEDGVELLKSGGLKFTKWEMLELSLVSVPANPDAMIQSFKSMDAAGIRESLNLEAGSNRDRDALLRSMLHGGIPLLPKHIESPLSGGAIRLIR